MNRAQRRASIHKHQQMRLERPRADPTTWAQVLSGSQTIEPAMADTALLRIHASFDELRAGRGAVQDNYHHMQVLAGAINSGMFRAEEIANPLLEEPMQKAIHAMMRAEERRHRIGRYGFDGPGLQDIAYALEVYEEILRNSSEKQMVDAEKKSHDLALAAFRKQQATATP